MTIKPSHSLRVVLPYHRRRRDYILESLLPLASTVALRLLPRNGLPREQLTALGIPAPPTLERDLAFRALREILRLLRRGWNRLDLRPLQTNALDRWREPGPILFLSMHHGQWEWLAGILTKLHPGALCVARAPSHPWGRRLLDWLRGGIGLRMSYDHQSLRLGRHQLGTGGLLAFLADQRPPGVSRPGLWMGHPTLVSRLPEWWTKGNPSRIWTGVLHPGSGHYVLELKEWDSQVVLEWDLLLDQEFLPLLAHSPADHFGLWHQRLKARIPVPH
jgi:hypothetical protein